VTMRRGRLAARDGGPPPGDFEVCGEDDVPAGFSTAVWAYVPIVDMVPYLRYLLRRLEAAGGRVEQRPVTGLDQIAAETARVVNCAGLGARELAGDTSMLPIFGQHVIVENPGLEEFFLEAPFPPEWVGYWPYPDHVVIGGVQRPGDESAQPDLELAERMLRNSITIEPRLAGARVLDHQVGIRPGRPRPRLELEAIGGATCLHNYGNGSSGVTHSWGAAEAGVALLLGER
jgi:D-amino-acid oxidase